MRLFLFIATAICFCSCTHVYYAPSSSNTPLFREKNEGMLNASFITADEGTGAQVQSAYAVGKNIGVQLNFMTLGESETRSYNNSPTVITKGRGTYVEAAAGYFTPFSNIKFIFETYGGVGTGVVKNDYASSEHSKVGVTKIFIQPAIGLRLPNYQMSLATKFSTLMLKVKSSNLSSANLPGEYVDLDFVRNNKTSFLFEPTMSFRGGFKGFMFQAQLTLSFNINNNNLAQEESLFSFGFVIPFKVKPATKAKSE